MSYPPSFRPKQPQQQPQQQAQAQEAAPPPSFRTKPTRETGVQQLRANLAEVPAQFAKGAIQGMGAYGNIIDIIPSALGVDVKKMLPGEEAKRSREYEILEKLERGEVPSIAEFEELSDVDVQPRFSKAGSTSDIKEFLEELGYPKAQRRGGRYAERAGEIIGSTAAMSGLGRMVKAGTGPYVGAIAGPALKSGIGAAAAGQTAEEMGAPPWVQAVAEMITEMKLSKTKTPLSSGSPKVQRELDRLGELGFDEQDLTLARNALEEKGWLKKASKYTRQAEEKFKKTFYNVNRNIHNIIEDAFPGLSVGGPEAFKKIGTELFEKLDNFAAEVVVKKPGVFKEAVDKAVDKMERTLAKTPKKQEAIDLLQAAKKRADERTSSIQFKNQRASTTSDDFYSLRIYNKGDEYSPLGSITYYNKPNRLEIGMFQVPPEFKSRGYSILLLDELSKLHPNKEIYTGILLEEGEKFLSKLSGRKLTSGGTIFSLDDIKKMQQKAEKYKERLTPANAPGDFYTTFYKELNAIGDWGNPKQREAVFGMVKDAIKETFRKQGPQGVKLAEALEEANTAWIKYINAQDVSQLVNRATTEHGLNYKKFATILDNPDNKDIFIKSLGEKQTNNLIKLVEAGKSIGDLETAIKGGMAKDLLGHGTMYAFSKAVLNGDLSMLKTLLGIQIAGTYATKFLTDPSYQNLGLKMIDAAKDQKWNMVASIARAIEKKTLQDSLKKEEPKSPKKAQR